MVLPEPQALRELVLREEMLHVAVSARGVRTRFDHGLPEELRRLAYRGVALMLGDAGEAR